MSRLALTRVVTPQANFPRKITFDMLYTNEFVIRVRSRALSIPSEHNEDIEQVITKLELMSRLREVSRMSWHQV